MSSPMDAIEQAAKDIYGSDVNSLAVITAILRKHFGPSEPRIIKSDYDDSCFIGRGKLTVRVECLNPDETWTAGPYWFPTLAAAEAVLAKAKETP